MPGKTRSLIGTVATIVGYVYGGPVGVVVQFAGAALVYDGARRQQKEAERRARAGSRSPAIKGNVRGSYEHRTLVFGKARVGGIVVAVGTANGPDMLNQYLFLGVEHSLAHAGGCEGITDIWLDDKKITAAQMSGDPNAGEVEVIAGDFAGLVRLRHYRGTAAQVADPTLVGLGIDASTAHRKGAAWTWVRLKRTTDEAAFSRAFKFGIPNLTVELKGIRCYDPRLDTTNGGSGPQRVDDPLTWTWTSNPILCAATYTIMKELDGGMGLPAGRVDWASVASAASVCDENKNTPAGTRQRFVAGGVLSTSDKRDVNLQKILDACLGRRTRAGGKYKFYAASYRTPTTTIDQSWLAGGVSISTRSPLESLYNAVRINFDDEAQDYKVTEAPPFLNSSYEAEDGNYRLWRDQNLPMVSNTYDAQYLAQIIGKQSRKQMTVSLVCNLKALDLEPWEICTLDLPDSRVDLSGRVFRVASWDFARNGIELSLIEDDPGIYTVDPFTAPVIGAAPATGNETPPAPTGVVASAVADGIVINFVPPAAYLYRSIQIARATTAGGALTVVGTVGQGTSTYTDPVVDGATYFYRLRAVTKLGTLGPYSSEVSATAKQAADGSAQLAGNLGFEGGTTGWTADNGRWSVVNDPANARTGSWCAKFTSTGSAVTDVFRNTRKFAVAPGDLVLVYGSLKASSGANGTAHWRISWLDSAGVQIGASSGNILSPATTYAQSRVTAAAPANSAYAQVNVVGTSISTGSWYADDGYVVVTPKNLDEVPDGPIYGRPIRESLTDGQVDLSKVGVINRSADNISEGASRKWAAESGAQVVTGKSITVLSDVATEARFYTFTQTFLSGTNQSLVIPQGAKRLTIRGWGAGGGGARGDGNTICGGGGGGGAGCKKSVIIRSSDWGLSLTYSVGAAGAGATSPSTDGGDGGDTTVISSGLSFANLNLVAGGGKKGTGAGGQGAGGTASGGDLNVSGQPGQGDGAGSSDPGGNSATIDSIFGANTNPPSAPGGGGTGRLAVNASAGASGMITFTWEG